MSKPPRKVKVGIVGCGKISDAYFTGCRRYDILEVVHCADIDVERAKAKALEHGIPRASSVAELLANPEVEIVINLTVPVVHAEVNTVILTAGKHAYCEKPFGLNTAEGTAVLALARSKKLLTGCAPDTFLGGGLQTARKAIDDGLVGRPIAAMAFLQSRGVETWHPNPEFYYKRGGGPMFDMGPYYLTALINFFGPIARVTGSASISFHERLITSQPFAGKKITVDTPTHVTGVMDFVNGMVVNIFTSFDVHAYPLPRILVYGETSTLEAPDPNMFDGDVSLRSNDGKSYEPIALTHSIQRGRGSGVADMAYALLSGRPHRASGELAQHVVEVMEAFERSSVEGRHITIKSTCARPAALPVGLAPNELDL